MKTKVAEATNTQLDYLVAKCEGHSFTLGETEYTLDGKTYQRGMCSIERKYTTDWSEGGPILEKERIDLLGFAKKGVWVASIPRPDMVGWRFLAEGPTPLIAAMRCFVASKLGDEVEVQEGLA